MESHSKAESGLQLFARLKSGHSLVGLDNELFPDGPNSGDFIEICGEEATGKTLLLMQFLVKSLLPTVIEEVNIGGLGIECAFINTDHHFHIIKLVNMMELYLKDKLNNPSSSTIEKIITDSLNNLTLLNCYDSIQLQITLHSLQKILSSNTNINLILLDSLSAYYWQDVLLGGSKKMDLYIKTYLETIHKSVKDFNVTVIYTKQFYFQSKQKIFNEFKIQHRIYLKKNESENDLFILEMRERGWLNYKITAKGICLLINQ